MGYFSKVPIKKVKRRQRLREPAEDGGEQGIVDHVLSRAMAEEPGDVIRFSRNGLVEDEIATLPAISRRIEPDPALRDAFAAAHARYRAAQSAIRSLS